MLLRIKNQKNCEILQKTIEIIFSMLYNVSKSILMGVIR